MKRPGVCDASAQVVFPRLVPLVTAECRPVKGMFVSITERNWREAKSSKFVARWYFSLQILPANTVISQRECNCKYHSSLDDRWPTSVDTDRQMWMPRICARMKKERSRNVRGVGCKTKWLLGQWIWPKSNTNEFFVCFHFVLLLIPHSVLPFTNDFCQNQTCQNYSTPLAQMPKLPKQDGTEKPTRTAGSSGTDSSCAVVRTLVSCVSETKLIWNTVVRIPRHLR